MLLSLLLLFVIPVDMARFCVSLSDAPVPSILLCVSGACDPGGQELGPYGTAALDSISGKLKKAVAEYKAPEVVKKCLGSAHPRASYLWDLSN